MIVESFTNLTIDLYRRLERYIPKVSSEWWLATDSWNETKGLPTVNAYGEWKYRSAETAGVRPVLRFTTEKTTPTIGSRFSLYGYTWTVIAGDAAICDETVGTVLYRKTRTTDETEIICNSLDLQHWVKNWGKQVMEKG